MFTLAFIRDNFTFILSALPFTLVITLIVLTLLHSLLGGAGVGDYSSGSRVQWGAKVFLSFSRSVPVLVMLYFFFTSGQRIAAGLLWRPQDNMYHYKLATGGGGHRAIADFQRVFRRNLSSAGERG
ncbi:hypothetical protein LNP26_19105 [Klebsiella variicola subsp. variicola]|nr:hypothetical protein [Klebsiella variicola subsp. variicola]